MSMLDRESKAYQDELPRLVQEHNGQYVVIQGSQVHHFADSYEHALDWAYERFGLDKFFVKKVAPDQDLAHFTRDLGPCRP